MSITVKGKVNMDSFRCQECSTTIYKISLDEKTFCQNCGTVYEPQKPNLNGDQVSVDFSIIGYVCMEAASYVEKCANRTMTPFMYCEHHSSDEYIKKVESSLESIKNNLQRATDKLDRVKESRRNWMISKLGGISE